MPAESWVKWFVLWGVRPETDGTTLWLSPTDRVPKKHVDLIRDAKLEIIGYLIGQRDMYRALLEHGLAWLEAREGEGTLDDHYREQLTIFEDQLAEYERFAGYAPSVETFILPPSRVPER